MSEIKSIKKRLFKNVSWLLGGKAAAGVFSSLQTVIVARMLGVSDYGVLAIILAYVDVLNNFFDFRVWETATKYMGTFWASGQRKKTLSMIKLSYIIDISTGILAFAVAVVTAKIASSHFLRSPEAYTLIYIYAFSLLIDTASSTSNAILRVFDQFKSIAFISSLSNLLKLALVVTAIALNMGIKGILFAYAASSFLGFGIRLCAISRILKEKGLEEWWKSDVRLIKDQWKEIAWFLGNTSLAGTLKMVNDKYLGVLALGYFSTKEAAAYYKIARSFARLLTAISDPLYEAIYPELVRIWSFNGLRDFKKLLKYSTKTLMKFTVPAVIVTLLFPELLINLIFGKQYVTASNALRVISLAVLMKQLTFWINPALLAFGKPGLRTILGIISISVYVVFLLILVPRYSYIGAAFAFLVHSIVKASISIVALRSSINEKRRLIDLEVSEPLDRKV